jgi:hypothetical protein
MSQPRDERQDDLFRPSLAKIINLRRPLVRLADFLAGRFSSVCRLGPGQPPLPTRLVAGLFILEHMRDLSDKALCDRWIKGDVARQGNDPPKKQQRSAGCRLACARCRTAAARIAATIYSDHPRG